MLLSSKLYRRSYLPHVLRCELEDRMMQCQRYNEGERHDAVNFPPWQPVFYSSSRTLDPEALRMRSVKSFYIVAKASSLDRTRSKISTYA